VREFVQVVNACRDVRGVVLDNIAVAFKALPYVKGERRRAVSVVLREVLSRMSAMELMEFPISLPPKVDVIRRIRMIFDRPHP